MADPVALVDGTPVAQSSAALPVDDRAFLYGESVFTTLRVDDRRTFRLVDHVARLNRSLAGEVLVMDYRLELKSVAFDIDRLLTLNDLRNAVVRITVGSGRGSGPDRPATARPVVVMTARALRLDESLYRDGVALVTSTYRRDPSGVFGRHKLGSYAPLLAARRAAKATGAYDGIVTDTDGNLLECCCSNLWLAVDGAAVTPGEDQNLLPGIGRQAVMDCAEALGIEIRQMVVPPTMVECAQEAFVTNSVVDVLPVRRIDGRDFGGVPGEVTRRLMAGCRRMRRGG